MIHQIILKDFQVHKETKLDFKNNLFICIIGSSRSGKSSFVRALRWVFFDRWKSSFVRIGSSSASVTLKYDNIELKREKGKTKNDLILNGEKYSSFGNEYPLEFLRFFPWAQNKFEKLIIASQDDYPFLLYDDGSTRREIFDFLIGIEGLTRFVDDIQHEINKKNIEERTLKDEVNKLKERIKDKNELLLKYKRLLNLYDLIKEVEEKRNNMERLLKLKNFIDDLNEKINALSSRIRFLLHHQEVFEKIDNFTTLLNLKKKIDEICNQISCIENTVNEKKITIESMIKEGLVCPTCGQKIEKL